MISLTKSTVIDTSLTMDVSNVEIENPIDLEKIKKKEKKSPVKPYATTIITFKGDGVVFPRKIDMKVNLECDVGTIMWDLVHKVALADFPCNALQLDKIFLGFEYDIMDSPVFYKMDTMVMEFFYLPYYPPRSCKVFYCVVSQ